jgi:hypothetical protein
MTIAKAMQSDKAFCRRVKTLRAARWRAKHRERYNAYMRVYMRDKRRQRAEGVKLRQHDDPDSYS